MAMTERERVVLEDEQNQGATAGTGDEIKDRRRRDLVVPA